VAVRIYLSPHLDDAVLSCGGLIARQVATSDVVTVLTICAGEPGREPLSDLAQSLHARWGMDRATAADRRTEDRMACGRLGASVIHYDLPDAIYRRATTGEILYPTEESLFGPIHPAEAERVAQLAAWLAEGCPAEADVYCPLGLGGHVDHRLTRAAAEQTGRPLWYYRDFPYAARGGNLPNGWTLPGKEMTVSLSPEEVQTWGDAITEYRSQLSTFWDDPYAQFEELRAFHDGSGGLLLRAPAGSP